MFVQFSAVCNPFFWVGVETHMFIYIQPAPPTKTNFQLFDTLITVVLYSNWAASGRFFFTYTHRLPLNNKLLSKCLCLCENFYSTNGRKCMHIRDSYDSKKMLPFQIINFALVCWFSPLFLVVGILVAVVHCHFTYRPKEEGTSDIHNIRIVKCMLCVLSIVYAWIFTWQWIKFVRLN